MNKRIVLIIAVVLGSVTFFNASSVKAISISPVSFELTANPGDKVSNFIRVYNDQNYAVGVSIEVENFTAAGEEGRVVIETSEVKEFSLKHWVTVSPSTFVLPARGFKQVEYTVSVPLGAEPGGHYGSVLAVINGSELGGGLGTAQKIASLLLMNVSGKIREELTIKDFTAPHFSEYGPVSISTRFENTGNVHLKPRGLILIKNIFGSEVAQVALPQNNVLPGTIRKIDVNWGDKYMFGKYEAILTAIYGSTNEPASLRTQFWVIPWRLGTAILLVFIAAVFLLIRSRRRIWLAIRIIIRGH